jgi:CubicO group peptidase (beta-lactamase class C family)
MFSARLVLATALTALAITDVPVSVRHLAIQARFASAIEEGQHALREMVATAKTPGVAVAVAIGRDVVWTEGFGLANLELAVPVSSETRFGIGSISKTLTMAAAVRLRERGLLDLDAPVERYLTDFAHKGRGITVRRIAAHQSGMSDAFSTEHYATTRHFATLESAYREIQQAPLEYEPGTRAVYATGTYTVIGRVMEAVSGRDYQTLMREEVFHPSHVAIVANDRRAIIPHRAGFYDNRDGGGFEHGPFFDPSYKLPGAGWLATARELAQFGSALLGAKLLSDHGRAEMFRTVPLADGTPTEYALGLQRASGEAGEMLHIPGGGIGISSWLFIYPDREMVIALLANVNTAPVGGQAHRRIAAAFGAAR